MVKHRIVVCFPAIHMTFSALGLRFPAQSAKLTVLLFLMYCFRHGYGCVIRLWGALRSRSPPTLGCSTVQFSWRNSERRETSEPKSKCSEAFCCSWLLGSSAYITHLSLPPPSFASPLTRTHNHYWHRTWPFPTEINIFGDSACSLLWTVCKDWLSLWPEL